MFYVVFNSWELLCNYETTISLKPEGPFFCNSNSAGNILPVQQYYYTMFTNPCKACFVIIFIEMVVYLAYFKDTIFSSVVLCNFVGMLTLAYSFRYK
jgi:hypothetical protein